MSGLGERSDKVAAAAGAAAAGTAERATWSGPMASYLEKLASDAPSRAAAAWPRW